MNVNRKRATPWNMPLTPNGKKPPVLLVVVEFVDGGGGGGVATQLLTSAGADARRDGINRDGMNLCLLLRWPGVCIYHV